jgi:hypothetical protein
MATATPYYRIPVVIFAVLVGGLYVYAKGGGQLLQKRTQVTPATNSQGEGLAPPRIEFMMGPKSAPAFEKSPTYQPSPQPQQKVQPAPVQPAPRQVLPGSKSRAVIDPPTYSPAKPVPNAEPVNIVPNQTRLLPGSKSVILIDPQTVTPPTNSGVKSPPANAKPPSQPQQQAQPMQPAPQQPRTRVLPGSKSAILIEPSTIVPPPNNSAKRQQAQPQPAPRQPAYQQPPYQRPAQQPSNSDQRSNSYNKPAPVER